MAESKIEWTDKVWNPVTGCTKVSAGCAHCYAESMARRRMSAEWRERVPMVGTISGFGPRRFTDVRCHPDRLEAPLHWRKPARIFVDSMGDLFHADVPFEFVDKVFAVMALCPQHTFLVLTKRPERMREYVQRLTIDRVCQTAYGIFAPKQPHARSERLVPMFFGKTWDWWRVFRLEEARRRGLPLPNVWIGTSVEDQPTADARIPWILETPAAVRYVSCEPLLGPVDFDLTIVTKDGCRPRVGYNALTGYVSGPDEIHPNRLDLVIVGGENGPRPCNVAWIRSIVQQCQAAGTACYVKQLGTNPYDGDEAEPTGAFRTNPDTGRRQMEVVVRRLPLKARKGNDPAEWPADLRVRELPEVTQ